MTPAANRQNSQSSTGPRTESGKAASSQNGRTHGLSSQFALLAHESLEDFRSLAQAVTAELEPEGEHETFLVQQMIEARWRLDRIVAHMAGGPNSDVLATLQRHAASAERSYQQNYRLLLHGRQVAQRMTQKVIDNHIKNTIFAPLPPNGFVPQTAKTPQTPPPSKPPQPERTR
jgi:hypothetical protein